MIRTLTGTVTDTSAEYLIIETAGVGYLVHCPVSVTSNATTGTEITVWIHQHVSDDAINLYGFAAKEEVAFFEQLLTVSGIGPKKALSIMTVADAASIRAAIRSGESKQVARTIGVGKKVADKIVLELQNKVEEMDGGDEAPSAAASDGETVEALTSLGYSTKEARDAVKHVSDEAVDTNDRIREALKVIGS